MAVEWDTPTGPQTGVFIPRRDSDSWVNIALGGRFYPGEHHRARFAIEESDQHVRVAYTARDDSTQLDVSVHLSEQLSGSRLFADLAEASAFFEAGAVGYSATRRPERFDGLKLRTSAWRVQSAVVDHAHSSFFEDLTRFPADTAELDSALLMRGVPVVWEPLTTLHGEVDPVV